MAGIQFSAFTIVYKIVLFSIHIFICIIKMNSSLQKFTLFKILAYSWIFKLLKFRPAEKMLYFIKTRKSQI